MKYMGSKKSMLKNGLGELLLQEAPKANRLFDPFCGSSSVVWFLAEKTDKQVVAGDLQKFSVDLANSILLRNEPIKDAEIKILENWINLSKCFHDTVKIELELKKTKKFVFENRKLSRQSPFPITHAYAGYYFSIDQALKIDSLLFFLPDHEPVRSLAIAGLIEAASQCVAAPGHTAQPFQPGGNGLTAIIEAWKRDPFFYVERIISELSQRHSNKIGIAKTSNALDLLDLLEDGDLAFIDPPYSGVHYSRFYHVLETISRNSWENVSGRGRYPNSSRRPKSDYSLRGKSYTAFDNLLKKISNKKASAIVTFPANDCSNGLSGSIVRQIAASYFKVTHEVIKGRFSTMGGNNNNRPARHASEELVLVLQQK
jgi:adenine-specific DNA-methyltransferase